MTSPATAISTPAGRVYINPLRDPSPEYISVTRVITDGVPKHLENWFKRTTAEYAVDQQAIWQQLPRDAAVDLIKREADRVRDAAAARGNVVHALLEAATSGQRDDRTWKPEISGYVDAGLRFLDEWQPEVVWAETTVYSDTHLYAGTLDLLAHLPGLGLTIVDWKTSSDIYAETGLQLAAYRHADYALIDNTEQPLPAINAGAAVHLRHDGTYDLVPLACGPDQHALFLHATHVARFTSEGWKHVKGTPLPSPSPAVVLAERKAWLRTRLEYLRDRHPGALDSIAAMWPAGVPTLRHDGHTLEQVEQIRTIVSQVEAAFGVPFGQPDPLAEAAAPEVRTALADRLSNLPADLLDDVTAAAKEAGVPHVRTPLFSRAHADRLEPLLVAAEQEAASRQAELRRLGIEALDGDADLVPALLSLVGVTGDVVEWAQLEQFAALCNAVTNGRVALLAADDGGWSVTCPDGEQLLVAKHGSKSAALAVCREIAGRYSRPTPRSTAAAVGDPVLVALALSTSTTNPDTQEMAS